MNRKTYKRILIYFFCLILIIGILLITISFFNTNFDAIKYISGLSTFFVVLLTLMYVYTTSEQLYVMNEQLKEMKKERELQHQPLPWIKKLIPCIEKPRLFYDPIIKKHLVICRCMVYVEIKNIGMFPAICTDISSKIILSKGSESTNGKPTKEKPADEPLILDSVSLRIDTLEEKQTYPPIGTKANFHFAGDNDGYLLEALLNQNIKCPTILISILFKNTLGGCFVILNRYAISIPEEKEEIIKEWLSLIRTFPIKYMQELNTLIKLRKDNREKWNEIFDRVNSEVAAVINFDNKDLELNIIPVPNTFSLKQITNEEYEGISSNISYGMPMVLLRDYKCAE